MIELFMLFIAVFAIILLTILILFSFPQFSPIPYFPSNKKDLPLIIKSFNLKKNQTIIDLGAGDGIVIFEGAKKALKKKLNTKFIAVEINPVLIFILYFRKFFHPNKKNIRIIYGNMFSMNFSFLTTHYSLLTTFYLYISPWYLEKTISNIKNQIKHFSVVSYMYPIKSLKRIENIIHGKNQIYIYPVFTHDRK